MPHVDNVVPRKILNIEVLFADESDLDFMRQKLTAAVEEYLEENDKRLDGNWDVNWEVEDVEVEEGV